MPASFEIQCQDSGKKFGRDWIFKGVNEQFRKGEKVAILGPNGSGKSTFLMSISGFYALSKGKVAFVTDGKTEEDLDVYRHYSLISPLLDLPDDFSIDEFLDMHFRLKKMKSGWDKERMYSITGLENAKNRQLKNLSSGMRQRIKLLMAFVPDVPVVFLDEPCTNLDEKGIELYRTLVEESRDQLLLIASNMKAEYDFCERIVSMEELR